MAMQSSGIPSTSRVDRLCLLYAQQFGDGFDPGEFLTDDFYAFQVLERAFQAGNRNRELHNLSVLMHAERKALMETGLRLTLDLAKVASQQVMVRQDQESAEIKLRLQSQSQAAPAPRKSVAPAKPPGAAERRSGKVRLSPREINQLSAMRRLYYRQFGQSFDVEEFAGNDLYAKVVLCEACAAGDAELAALAAHFLDSQGKPRMHRRKGRVDLELTMHGHGAPVLNGPGARLAGG